MYQSLPILPQEQTNIGAPDETWNFNINQLLMYFVNVFNPMLSV